VRKASVELLPSIMVGLGPGRPSRSSSEKGTAVSRGTVISRQTATCRLTCAPGFLDRRCRCMKWSWHYRSDDVSASAGAASGTRASKCAKINSPYATMNDVDQAGVTPGVPLRLLADSNFVITLEPYAGEMEPGQPLAAEVVRLASEQGHRIFVHPATRDDLLEGTDAARRAQRLAELEKFPSLVEGPIPVTLTTVLGQPSAGSNDDRDLRLLAALHNNAATYLVSDDGGLRKRAARVGLGERVLTLLDAVELLRQLAPMLLTPPPRVEVLPTYALDADQGIFRSLRDDYAEFDQWLDSVVRPDDDNRDCLVVEEDGRYAALVIVKRREEDCAYDFPQPVTKIATFKVNTDYVGRKYGELLLKSLFMAARNRDVSSMYVEVLPKHEVLVHLLRNFGFMHSGRATSRGEHVLVKYLVPPPDPVATTALEHHIAYGPPAILGTGQVFIVPILPEWHEQLFPDAPSDQAIDLQLELIPEPRLITHPWGNALRKAYLSNSRITRLRPGDTILFYRSRGTGTVTAVGVVEDTMRSTDPLQIIGFVGGRTVYTPDEIGRMATRVGGVLAILFRQDRFIDPPWDLTELQANDVVATWPQSITQVRARGAQWVHDQLRA
jgi:L-amino acid N-acyltransferase YncA